MTFTIKLYGIANCSTVKKARTWLDNNGVAYAFHDFKKHGIDASTLENWLTQTTHEKLINRAGLTWRGLSDAEKKGVVDNTSAMKLMQAKTSVIKRPILVSHQTMIALGFDATIYGEKITQGIL